MKNLKELAAEFNLFKVEDIPAKFKGENFKERIEIRDLQTPEELKTFPFIEIGLFYDCITSEHSMTKKKTHYIDSSFILLKDINSDILLMLQRPSHGKGKYYFHPYYGILRKYQDISHSIKEPEVKKLKEPNLIGVPTANKVKDWLKYCADYIETFQTVKLNFDNKANEVKQEIENAITCFKGANIHRWKNNVDINTEHFHIRLVHYSDSNYLSKEIKFTGGLIEAGKIHNKMSN